MWNGISTIIQYPYFISHILNIYFMILGKIKHLQVLLKVINKWNLIIQIYNNKYTDQ